MTAPVAHPRSRTVTSFRGGRVGGLGEPPLGDLLTAGSTTLTQAAIAPETGPAISNLTQPHLSRC